MIAGELESTFDDTYDYFTFGKKNKQAKSGAAAKPRVSFGQKLQKVGEKIEKAGGVEAIGKTVDNVRSFFRKSSPNTTPPSDYEFEIKKSEENSTGEQDQNKDKDKKKKDLLLTGALIAGGIVIVGGVIWWMSNQNKEMASTITQSTGPKQ